MINQHISVMPIVPTAINPDFPHDVEKILLKSLEKKSEQRYQSAGEMTEELGTALSSLPSDLRTQPLVTPEQIEASTQLDNHRKPLVTAVLPQADATEPLAEPATDPRRRLLSLVAVAVIIVALALGITAVIRPIQERALNAEQTAQALMELGPIVITQLVTNEAGEPVYIEVTRIVTYMPGQASPTPSPENTATLTPTSTGTTTPTPTPTSRQATGSTGASEPEPTSTPAPTRTPDSNITQPPYTNSPDPGGVATRPPQNPTNTPKPGSGVGPQPPTRPTNTPGNSDNEPGNDTLSNGG
jgi:serine/threonine protein kinase